MKNILGGPGDRTINLDKIQIINILNFGLVGVFPKNSHLSCLWSGVGQGVVVILWSSFTLSPHLP